MKPYSAILFDFDGVLGKTMEDNYRAWAHAFSAFDRTITKEEYFLLEGMSPLMVAEHFLGRHDVNQCSQAVSLKEKYYLEHHSFSFYEGAESVVAQLKEKKFLLSLVSGASRHRLMNSGIHAFLSLFHVIITADDIMEGKPSPCPYLEAAKQLRVDPSECVVIENAPLGIQSAKAAHMDCIAIASTLSREHLQAADWIVKTITDLPPYLEKSNMRSSTLGVIPNLAEKFSTDFTLEMYRRASFTRQFEFKVKKAFDDKLMQIPIYLCIGQEFISAALSMIVQGFHIFGQHRGHGLYLSFGGPPEGLRDELLGLPTGCSRGMSGSNAIQCPEIGMFGHSGLMGEQVPIAVGAALGSRQPCLTIMGDASAEEDYIYPSLGYAVTKKLPVLFVVEDNGLSILTPIEVRRNWSMVRLAQSLGMSAINITDDPWLIAHHAKEMSANLPALMNVQTVRHLWHAGTGRDGQPEWDRYALVQAEMHRLRLTEEMRTIEQETLRRAETVWGKVLLKR